MPTDRAEVVRMLREDLYCAGHESAGMVGYWLVNAAGDLEHAFKPGQESKRSDWLRRVAGWLDKALARTRSKSTTALCSRALERVGELRCTP